VEGPKGEVVVGNVGHSGASTCVPTGGLEFEGPSATTGTIVGVLVPFTEMGGGGTVGGGIPVPSGTEVGTRTEDMELQLGMVEEKREGPIGNIWKDVGPAIGANSEGTGDPSDEIRGTSLFTRPDWPPTGTNPEDLRK